MARQAPDSLKKTEQYRRKLAERLAEKRAKKMSQRGNNGRDNVQCEKENRQYSDESEGKLKTIVNHQRGNSCLMIGLFFRWSAFRWQFTRRN